MSPADTPMLVSRNELLDFAVQLGVNPKGGVNVGPFDGAKPLNEATPTDIAFCRFEGEHGLALTRQTQAGAVFVPETLATMLADDGPLYLPCPHPRLALLRFLQKFWREPHWDYDPASNPCIHPEARIGSHVRVGPFTVIGPDVEIADHAEIGSNCRIEHASLGRHVVVGSSVTIGGAGFGYETDEGTGEVLQFPHVGGVRIGDRVEIGSSTCIDRGSIGDTVIGADTKIDNLVYIAHNVQLGERCKVIALASVGGSCSIGDEAWIAPAAAIRDWRRVGAGAVVGLGAVVTKHVAPGATVVGNPAKEIATTPHRYK